LKKIEKEKAVYITIPENIYKKIKIKIASESIGTMREYFLNLINDDLQK
jgi:hypothetical protein